MDVTTTLSLVAKWPAWAPRLLSLFRIMLAFIFLQAGTMKLVAFPIGMPPNGGTAPLWSEFWVAGVLETVACLREWVECSYFTVEAAWNVAEDPLRPARAGRLRKLAKKVLRRRPPKSSENRGAGYVRT